MVRAHRMSKEQRDLEQRSGDESHGEERYCSVRLAVPVGPADSEPLILELKT